MNTKLHTISALHLAFREAGMPIHSTWIWRQERKGVLKLPRSTTNFKKPQGTRKLAAVRLLTDEQITEIVKAFMPGGRGYWSYDEN